MELPYILSALVIVSLPSRCRVFAVMHSTKTLLERHTKRHKKAHNDTQMKKVVQTICLCDIFFVTLRAVCQIAIGCLSGGAYQRLERLVVR